MPAGHTVNIIRTFAAPRDLVFRMWTEEKHMQAWWGPRGNRNPICKLDARVGGEILMQMVGDGYDNAMGGKFLEIDPPKRLVFTSLGMPDDNGEYRIHNHNTVTFDEHAGVTTMTLKSVVQFVTEEIPLGGMEPGWSESIDKLIEHVGSLTARSS